MRTLCRVTWESDVQDIDSDSVHYESDEYWLLHFGLDYRIFEIEEGKSVAVNYTTAICEHKKSGRIECFLPAQLKILGREIKEPNG